MKRIVVFWLLSLILGFTLINCSEEESTTEPTAPACDQGCKDEYTAYGLVNVFWFIWNQNIAGQPVGAKDFTVAGPQGGTVHVTGTTDHSISTGVNTLHLVFQFSNCEGMNDKYNLIFNGTMTADGTFSLIHEAITYSSAMLSYSGTVGKDDWVTEVDDNCSININDTMTSVSGTICGRDFSY